MIESGSCGSAIISAKSECDAAATALDLSDKTANDQTSSTSSYNPPGCHFQPGYYSDLYVYGGSSSGSCSSSKQCICMFTPPSPPTSPPLPPWMPGFLRTAAGGYYMIESGSCGSAIISTTSE